MFDINDKKKLIEEIQAAVACTYTAEPYVYSGDYNQFGDYLTKYVASIANKIAKQVATDVAKETIKQIISRLYTHTEFETDLGLRDKP